MSTEVIATIILLGSFFLLIFLGNHILFSIGASTLLTVLYLGLPLQTVAQQTVKGLNSFSLMAVPFFILAGEIMSSGGITRRLVKLADALVGWMRCGLGMVNIVASTFFGGISGSPTADVSSIGAMLIPVMEDNGYDTEFSAAVTMASSVQGLLIPPSHNMVIFAMAAGGVSVGQLFMGGLVPGLFLGLALMIYCYIVARKKNYPVGDKFSLKRTLRATWEGIWGLGTVLIVVLGVVTGVFTATESAAIACIYALIVTFAVYREISLKEILNIMRNSLKTLAMVMALIGVSSAFGWVVSYLQIPSKLTNLLLGISSNKIVLLLLINLILLLMGTMMDMICSILIITPIILPVVTAIGMSPIQLGVIMILNLGIGLITPPVGVLLFVCSAIAKRSIEQLTKAMLPFYAVMVAVLLAITFIPQISTALPNLIYDLS
ncbi:TRAP transporter large permease [Oscillibacter sp. MSJ-2]|uniref:TRAP transporter large permease n=1 Tax=Dysosmobacter acutus TaxID=2841504 RepID=A0ABS6F6E3_9FIRM|nr:TRAP transporter large permease [Dysosmobacter acutus]MBU5625633.1 TRAP transporter large permease [Dysosmobacter acutus]